MKNYFINCEPIKVSWLAWRKLHWQGFLLAGFFFLAGFPSGSFLLFTGLGLQVCRDRDDYCDQGHAPLLHLQVPGDIQYLKIMKNSIFEEEKIICFRSFDNTGKKDKNKKSSKFLTTGVKLQTWFLWGYVVFARVHNLIGDVQTHTRTHTYNQTTSRTEENAI